MILYSLWFPTAVFLLTYVDAATRKQHATSREHEAFWNRFIQYTNSYTPVVPPIKSPVENPPLPPVEKSPPPSLMTPPALLPTMSPVRTPVATPPVLPPMTPITNSPMMMTPPVTIPSMTPVRPAAVAPAGPSKPPVPTPIAPLPAPSVGTCFPDGTVCGAGTTCNLCCNKAYNAFGTQCGGTCYPDGTPCGIGTTCNLCCSGNTTVLGFLGTCGTSPVSPPTQPPAGTGSSPVVYTPPSGNVTYQKGPVLNNVDVTPLFWSNPFTGETVTDASDIVAFYKAITNSAYIDWLSECKLLCFVSAPHFCNSDES